MRTVPRRPQGAKLTDPSSVPPLPASFSSSSSAAAPAAPASPPMEGAPR